MGIIESLTNDQENTSLVCHYTSSEIAINHIIPSGKIRLNPLEETNDPKENRLRYFNVFGGYNNGNDIQNELRNMVLKKSKILCLTQQTSIPTNGLNKKRAFGKPRMWSQYGDKHKGVCYVFDKDKLRRSIDRYLANNDFIFHDSVYYNDQASSLNQMILNINTDNIDITGQKRAIIDHLSNYKKELFFSKDSDWESEDEYRYVVNTNSYNYEYLPVIDSLTAIVLGIDFPNSGINPIKYYCDNNNLGLIKLSWDDYRQDFNLHYA